MRLACSRRPVSCHINIRGLKAEGMALMLKNEDSRFLADNLDFISKLSDDEKKNSHGKRALRFLSKRLYLSEQR
jgi:hypothetical protein